MIRADCSSNTMPQPMAEAFICDKAAAGAASKSMGDPKDLDGHQCLRSQQKLRRLSKMHDQGSALAASSFKRDCMFSGRRV